MTKRDISGLPAVSRKDLVTRLRTWVGNPLCIEAAKAIEERDLEIERLRHRLATIAKHPDVPELIKQYADGRL